jgi:two-component system phosphate regulon sensor histidine kinase PhoR
LTLLLGISTGGLVWLWWRQRGAHAVWQQELAEAHARGEAAEASRQAAVAEALAQRATLIHSMAEGVVLLDGEGRIQLVNHTFERLFGIQGDARGQTILEAVRSHELDELVRHARSAGQVSSADIEWRGPPTRSLQVNAARVTGGRTPGLILLVIHDQTRLKQLENTRKEFVANVSHELRTPLSLIKGYVETLLDGAKDDPALAQRFLQTIAKHTDRLTYLIEDLLTISRLESGPTPLNPQPTGLRELAARTVDDLARRAAERQVTLTNEIPADLVVRVDADRVQQVLFNLVDNAIKYGRVGGHVTLEAQALDEAWVNVGVHDDGPGVPAEARHRIFERFYRVDKNRSRDQGGTGLGLAIVKHIVQNHGGEVRLASEVGQGATFHFTLPRERTAV